MMALRIFLVVGGLLLGLLALLCWRQSRKAHEEMDKAIDDAMQEVRESAAKLLKVDDDMLETMNDSIDGFLIKNGCNPELVREVRQRVDQKAKERENEHHRMLLNRANEVGEMIIRNENL